MRQNTLIEIRKTPIRQLLEIYAREDGTSLTNEKIKEYTESLFADESGNEWVDLESGYRWTFNVILDDAVDSWLDDEPLRDLCPDILPEVTKLLGDRYSVLTLWDAHFDVQEDYFGDNDCDLYLELLGEIDNQKLPQALRDAANAENGTVFA